MCQCTLLTVTFPFPHFIFTSYFLPVMSYISTFCVLLLISATINIVLILWYGPVAWH